MMASVTRNGSGNHPTPDAGRAQPASDRRQEKRPDDGAPMSDRMTRRVGKGQLDHALLRVVGNLLGMLSKRRALVVVNYHRVLDRPEPMLDSEPDVQMFRWQMELLAHGFNVLPLHDALRALDENRLPPRAICITFDDGYRSIHDLALPILRELGLPATVFITSGVVGAGNMWNDRILHAVQSLPAGTLDLSDLGLERYQLDTPQSRKRIAHILSETGKYLPPRDRQALVERLGHLTGVDQEALMLTPDMVHALMDGGVEIGAHTVSHPILTCIDDDTARHEISTGKVQLESITGKPVRLFAYPNGKVDKDFDRRHVAMVKEAGFDAAFTTAVGAITTASDRYQLPRSRPWDSSPLKFGLRLLYWLTALRGSH